MAPDKQVAIIGAALDLGRAGEGSTWGPRRSATRGSTNGSSGIGYDVVDWGDVETAVQEASEETTRAPATCPRSRRRAAGSRGSSASQWSRVRSPSSSGATTPSPSARSVGSQGPGLGGVLWLDAHGDLNTPETSPTGNVHGMPLAAAIGLTNGRFASETWTLPAVEASRVALVGLRELDRRERERIRELGIRAYTMSDIDRIGIERAVRESLTQMAGPGFVHVSLDMDALDPEVAPGVGTPVRGGLSYREAHLALELVAESGIAGSFEVVEVNPILDRANETASLAVELVASALGKTIL